MNRSFALLASIAALGGVSAPALTFNLEEFAGTDSTLKVSISEISGGKLAFTLEIIKPPSPSDSDITGFWGNIDIPTAAISQLSVGGLIYNTGAPAPNYTFLKGDDSIDETTDVGTNNNNLNGATGDPTFDFAFNFGKQGLDNPPINKVYFELASTIALTESSVEGLTFGARLQPVSGSGSSKLIGEGVPPDEKVPDGGATLLLAGLGLASIGLVRRLR